MRKVFTILGCCMLLVWIVFYRVISERDCAFAPRSTCGIGMPWALRGDDLLYLVFAPALVTVGLFVLAWWTGRAD